MSKYSKINFIYFLQKWMDSVAGQTFLNYAYSWGAAIVILGTLFKLTHLPGANVMLFLGMGTEVIVFFISAFDRPFDKSTIDMNLDNHMNDEVIEQATYNPLGDTASTPVVAQQPQTVIGAQPQVAVSAGAPVVSGGATVVGGGTTVVGGGIPAGGTIIVNGICTENPQPSQTQSFQTTSAPQTKADDTEQSGAESHIEFENTENQHAAYTAPQVITPAPAVSKETAAEMETVTQEYVRRLGELNEMLEKVGQLTSRLSTDSEEMENLNRTLTGIARVYEMQLKSASQQITTQDSINEQTRIMAQKIQELNGIYTRMIEAMTVNMPGGDINATQQQ